MEPLERLLVERLPVERLPVDRPLVERELVERALVERPLVERPLAERVEVLRFAADRVEDEAARALDCVIAARSLSKSFSACLLVFTASRRSARIAAVTSL